MNNRVNNVLEWRDCLDKSHIEIINGTIFWTLFTRIYVSCSFNLKVYPFDTQICKMTIYPVAEHDQVKVTPYRFPHINCTSSVCFCSFLNN